MNRKSPIIILTVFAFVAGSCTTEHETEYVLPEMPVAIRLSVSQVVFPAEGGQKSVVAEATAAAPLRVETETPAWITLTEQDNLLLCTAAPNPSGGMRKCEIALRVGSGENSVRETLLLVQLGREHADLSTGGTANCYLVAPGGSYCFPATVKGSGNAVSDDTDGSSGLAVYIARYGTAIEDVHAARLLWESVPDGDLTSSHQVIDGDPVYGNGYIYFTTGTRPGNALIAACDASGTILWSWHIWSSADQTGTSTFNGYVWMDRNVGALNNTPGEVGNRGMLYQWGRKDPFPPSRAAYGDATPDTPNTSKGDGSLTPDIAGQFGTPYWEAPGNIGFSIRHPATFLAYAGYQSKDWYVASYEDDTSFRSLLWGDPASDSYSKSIFDPCPPGWVVPPDGAYATGREPALQGWSQTEEFGRYWTGGNGDFFPYSGYAFGVAAEAPLYATGASGAFWVAAPAPESPSSYFLQINETDAIQGYTNRMHGLSMRCVAKQ